MNWLSIIILGLLATCILNGFRRGMIRTLAAMLSLIVSVIVVYLVNPYVAEFLENHTPVYEQIEMKCEETFQDIAKKQTENVQQEIIQKIGIPESFASTLEVGENFTESAVVPLAETTAHAIVNGVSFVITFFALSILLRILLGLLDGLFRLPVLSFVNRLAGGIIGGAQGLLLLWMFFLIIFLIWDTQVGTQALTMIHENPVTEWLYNCNPFVKLIK